MTKHVLLAGVAAILATVPGAALAQDTGGGDENSRSNFELDFRNNIDTSIVTDVTYTKDVYLTGNVYLQGYIDVDSSAVAVSDSKQILAGNTVEFREENELNAENGWVSPVFGQGVSEAGQDPNDNYTDGVVQGQIRVGFFAPIINTVNPFDVSGEGNIGVNIAAGFYNMQANIATLAVSTGDSGEEADNNGWSEASTTALQSALFNYYGGVPGDNLPEDDEEEGGGGNNFRDRNTVTLGSVSGAGNIGVNAAAGAFNQQQNILTLASASDASLAEANAAVLQTSLANRVEAQDTINLADAGSISGAGNIGVNIAAGVGNMQHNSLTAAVSTASSLGNGNGGGGNDPS